MYCLLAEVSALELKFCWICCLVTEVAALQDTSNQLSCRSTIYMLHSFVLMYQREVLLSSSTRTAWLSPHCLSPSNGFLCLHDPPDALWYLCSSVGQLSTNCVRFDKSANLGTLIFFKCVDFSWSEFPHFCYTTLYFFFAEPKEHFLNNLVFKKSQIVPSSYVVEIW